MHALQALKNCVMLAVNRQNLHAVFRGSLHHERAARHKRLLVGERELLFGLQRRERRLEADHADDRIQHDVGALERRKRAEPLHAAVNAHAEVAHSSAQRFRRLQIKNRNCLRFEFPDLRLEQPDIGVRGERRHLDGAVRPAQAAHDVERLRADRARRAEQR